MTVNVRRIMNQITEHSNNNCYKNERRSPASNNRIKYYRGETGRVGSQG